MVVEGNPVLAHRYRGGSLESIHRGCWALVDIDGGVLAGAGEPDQWIFARSSSKSMQQAGVLPLGIVDRFGFGVEQLALMISSHNAEPTQVALVHDMLERIGLDESALQCGPAHVWADSRSERRRVHHCCSGKHAGFLAGAIALGQHPATYLDPNGLIQVRIHQAVAALAGIDVSELHVSIDGCSAPTFNMPMRALGRAIARVANPGDLVDELRAACQTMVAAAQTHPEMVAGVDPMRFDTEVMRVTNGRVFAKGGADGVRVLGVVGAGVAFVGKADDGNDRGLNQLALQVLHARDHVSDDEMSQLAEFTNGVILNADGLEVGRQQVVATGLTDLPIAVEETAVTLWPGATTSRAWTVTTPVYRATVVELGAHIIDVAVREGRTWVPVSVDYPQGSGQGYHGATVGRVANRIGGAHYEIDGVGHDLVANDGANHLHGGPDGFDQRMWHLSSIDRGDHELSIELCLTSLDGDQGHPGRVEVVTRLSFAQDVLGIAHRATTTAPTPINLASHVYWNLGDDGSFDGQQLAVRADRYLPTDGDRLPSRGAPVPVVGTRFDCFSSALPLDVVVDEGGFDHYYVFAPPRDGRDYEVVLEHDNGRRLEFWGDQRGAQIYTGDHLPHDQRGVAIELHAPPDAPNRQDAAEVTISPGQVYMAHSFVRFRGRGARR